MPEPKIVFAPMLDPEVRAIADRLLPQGFAFENVAAADVPAAIQDADFLCGFIGTLSTDVLVSAAMNRLKLVQLMSVGYDKFNLDGARAAKLPVSVNGGANAIAVAEHAIMLLLASLKQLTALDDAVRRGGWRDPSFGSLRLYEVWHSTIGIVGMGRIGQEVAKRLQGWDANLIYYDPFRLPAEREQALGVRYVELDELLRTSDGVTVHVPLNAQTRHLIDAESLSIMKPTAVLVNTARGELVDEEALVTALREGQIKGAGLDVLNEEPPPADHPIFALHNVALSPHMAGPTWQSFPRRFENCFANIVRVQNGEPAQWVVPELADLFA
jgi:phosphoglycerate dehydrogenase-like enzyme